MFYMELTTNSQFIVYDRMKELSQIVVIFLSNIKMYIQYDTYA